MNIWFAFELPDGDIHFSADVPVVPRVGDTVDLSSLLDKEDLASYEKYVQDFLLVVSVHHHYEPKAKGYHANIYLEINTN